MYFKQFNRKLSENITGVAVARQLRFGGHLIEMTTDEVITIDNVETEFSTILEAKDYIKQQYDSDILEQEIAQESYEEISDAKIASIIAEHYDVKVTDSLIESYVELASSKMFTTDPVAAEIRDLNKFDRLVEGKIDFVLEDGSIVAINKDTHVVINNLIQDNNEIVQHMRQNKENFISVVQQIKE